MLQGYYKATQRSGRAIRILGTCISETAQSGVLDMHVHCVVKHMQMGRCRVDVVQLARWNLAHGCGLVRALTLHTSRRTVTLRSYTQMQRPLSARELVDFGVMETPGDTDAQ